MLLCLLFSDLGLHKFKVGNCLALAVDFDLKKKIHIYKIFSEITKYIHQLFKKKGYLPVNRHHISKIACDGPPHLALVHYLLLGSDLKCL